MRGCDEVPASLKAIRGAHEHQVLTALMLEPKRLASGLARYGDDDPSFSFAAETF
jgi:hypothetical protein